MLMDSHILIFSCWQTENYCVYASDFAETVIPAIVVAWLGFETTLKQILVKLHYMRAFFSASTMT